MQLVTIDRLNMIITWFFGFILSCSLRGFCNGREIFVSKLGSNNRNCITKDNPCRTIQYAIDNMVFADDVIKIDGSLGTFALKRTIRISQYANITFTSYNGVAWIYRDISSIDGYGFFLATDSLVSEIMLNTINFRDTILTETEGWHLGREQLNSALTVRNCLFEFSKSMRTVSLLPQNLIAIYSRDYLIKIENCTIKANYKIGILSRPVVYESMVSSSIKILLKNTRIEDAKYTVYSINYSTDDKYHRSFKLTVINSTFYSRGKYQSKTSQFAIALGKLHMHNAKISIYMKNSRFENLAVLTATAAAMDVQGPSKVFIRNCTFTGNIGNKGGALSLQPIDLEIAHSLFYGNQATVFTVCAHKDKGGRGGAIFIDGTHGPMTMKIYNSSFINNKATCFGSAVYLGYFNTITVKQTKFNTSFTSSSDTMWFSYSENLLLDQVSFQAGEGSRLDGELFLARSRNLTLGARTPYFECPIGYTLNISDSNVSFLGNAKREQVRCNYCPKGTYTLTPSALYGLNHNKVVQRNSHPQCHSCRFGAVCQRGIKPKPNFWGYVHKGKAFMIVCPPGYCCQTPNQCIALNSCNSKRTGRLCGKCKHGYFQSVFTDDCLVKKACKVATFWALALMVCLLLTIVFIFLQDIFLFVVKILSMRKLALDIKRVVAWLKKKLTLTKIDSYQLEQSTDNERRGLDPICNELNDHREGEDVDDIDQLDVDKKKTEFSNNATAAGLIKIVFFFYQIHFILTIYKSNRETQYLRDLKVVLLSIFNLNAQLPVGSEFHCPFHKIDSIGKVWVKALFPINCLIFAAFLYTCICALSHCFRSNGCIQKYLMKVKVRLLTGMLQFILLGYSIVTSSILSLLTCLSLVNGERILYIDGNVPCYQTWQYAILMFIVFWAIPLIYTLHKLPSYMRNGEISIRGIYTAFLLPLPFTVLTMVRGVRKTRYTKVDERSNDEYFSPLIPYVNMQQTNSIMLQLLNVIEGPFRYKISEKKGEKLPWESILLLQRLLLSLCHVFILEPGMRSLLLLLFIYIFGNMNSFYRPFNGGFLNATNGIAFTLLFTTGVINAIYAFIYEYGSIPTGPLVQLLSIFDYLEVVIVLIFPVIAIGTLIVVAVGKFIGFLVSIVGLIIASCTRCKFHGD